MTTVQNPSPELQALADQLPCTFQAPAPLLAAWQQIRPENGISLDNLQLDSNEPQTEQNLRRSKRRRKVSPKPKATSMDRRKRLKVTAADIEGGEDPEPSIVESVLQVQAGATGDNRTGAVPTEDSDAKSVKKQRGRKNVDLSTGPVTDRGEEEEEVVAILAKGKEGRFVYYKVVFAGDEDKDAVWLKKSELSNCKGLIRIFEAINKV